MKVLLLHIILQLPFIYARLNEEGNSSNQNITNENELIPEDVRKLFEFSDVLKNISQITHPVGDMVLDEPHDEMGGGSVSTYIVGGMVVNPPYKYPWMAVAGGYVGSEKRFRCGGSLIAQNVVLTAAHCGKIDFVQLGRHDLWSAEESREERTVSRAIPHPFWNPNTIDYDYQILVLNAPFSSKYSPIALDDGTLLSSLDPKKTDFTIIGWGKTSPVSDLSRYLLQVESTYFPNSECGVFFPVALTNRMVCTFRSYKSPCSGDSGGPMFYLDTNGRPIQIGVVSFGLNGCLGPAIYASVGEQADWINSNLCSYAGINCGGTSTPAPVVTSQTEPSKKPSPAPTVSSAKSPTSSPTKRPLANPTASPSDSGPIGCVDDPTWAVEEKDCNHFNGRPAKCNKALGSQKGSNGLTAKQVCCICGASGSSPTPIPPTPIPPSPPSGPTECVDDPSWAVEEKDCNHFNGRPAKCDKALGSQKGSNGLTAKQVCCICGASGSSPVSPITPTPPGTGCTDDPGWNIGGRDCAHFQGRPAKCNKDIGSAAGSNGLSANQVCCVCANSG